MVGVDTQAGLSPRTTRQLVRVAIAIATISTVAYITLTPEITDSLHSNYHSIINNIKPSLLGNSRTRPQLPTHLWSYVDGVTADASERIAAAKEAQLQPDGSYKPTAPLADGFEWVLRQQRKSGLTEAEKLRMDYEYERWGGGNLDSKAEGTGQEYQDVDEALVGLDEADYGPGEGIVKGGKRIIWPSVPRRPSWGALKLQGAKKSIQTNLRDDMKYYMSFPVAGFTNEVMDCFLGIWIAILARRTPIIAPFSPDGGHMQRSHAQVLPMGDVFDLNYFRSIVQVPLVELHELRLDRKSAPRNHIAVYDGEVPISIDADGTEHHAEIGQEIMAEDPETEELACWNFRMPLTGAKGSAYEGLTPSKIHWSPMPRHIYANGDFRRWSIHMAGEVMNKFNGEVTSNHSLPWDSNARLEEINVTVPEMLPGNRLACSDSVYYGKDYPFWDRAGSEWREGRGAWQAIGQHMHFQPGLIRMADDMLRHMWDLAWDEEVPLYMAVHIRRGDFQQGWKNVTPRQFAYKAWEVLNEARLFLGVEIKRIIVTTDETDPEWTKPLVDIGWTFVDHATYQTSEKLGYWFPTILDTLILARSKVLLRNPHSTMSLLQGLRVETWNQGMSRAMDMHQKVPDDWEWDLQW